MAELRFISDVRYRLRGAGKSLFFNGSSDYATLGVIPSTAGFSVGFWIKRMDSPGNRQVVSFHSASGNDGFEITLPAIAPNRIIFNVKNSSTTVAYLLGNGFVIGKWIHVVATYEPNSVKLYINGSLAGTDTSATMTSVTAIPLTLGRASQSSAQFMKMNIAEFVFKNGTPWTQTEIQDLCFRGIIPLNPTCCFNFNDNVTDQSGNGNNITLNSGTSYSTDIPYGTRPAVTNRPYLGNLNHSLLFSTDSYIDLGVDSYNLDYNGRLSGGLWVNFNKIPTNASGLITKSKRGTPYDGWQLVLNSTRKLQFDYTSTDSTNHLRVLSDALPLSICRWNHIGFTYNDRTVKFYFNGVYYPVATTTYENLTQNYAGNYNLNIGNRNNNESPGDHDYLGYIADPFMASDVELSLQNFIDVYFNRKYPSSITSRWRFDDGSGSTVEDIIGAIDGTITNCTFSNNIPGGTRATVS